MQDTKSLDTNAARTRRPLAVRKPKATAGWAEGAAATAEVPFGQPPAVAVEPAIADRPKAHHAPRGQGKAGQSAAERTADLRSAYKARMAAMRTSRVGGARRQARNAPEPDSDEPEVAPAPESVAPDAQPAAPTLRLSRSQRKRLARSARSTAVIDAALVRAGIANPVTRAALADAIAAGAGDGDDAMAERVSRALTS